MTRTYIVLRERRLTEFPPNFTMKGAEVQRLEGWLVHRLPRLVPDRPPGHCLLCGGAFAEVGKGRALMMCPHCVDLTKEMTGKEPVMMYRGEEEE